MKSLKLLSQKAAVTACLFAIVAAPSKLFSQDALLLSERNHKGQEKTLHTLRIEAKGWRQAESVEYAAGGKLTYAPFFKNSLSELRVGVGFFGPDKRFENVREITPSIIFPEGNLINISTGYTKVFPQRNAKSYYEIALNLDAQYTYRDLRIGDSKFQVGNYYVSGGVEVIPIPPFLSIYGNYNAIIATTGSAKLEGNFLEAPVNSAEFIDAGIKGIYPFCKWFSGSLQFGVLLTDKSIRSKMHEPENVVPFAKSSLIFKVL